MATPKIKEELYHFIEEGDAKLINMLYAVAKEYTQENYALPGKPMTINQLKTRGRSAKARIEEGRYTSQDGLEKEMKEW
ncbi:hypothetical protein [Marivirga sp.]|uniref:hypothetical protein n=1 Tax=Marivirga sp. TaxID=2018662 RepID=UPI0025E8D0BC|nr:hypothetical protein [Marivirga sp.]